MLKCNDYTRHVHATKFFDNMPDHTSVAYAATKFFDNMPESYFSCVCSNKVFRQYA